VGSLAAASRRPVCASARRRSAAQSARETCCPVAASLPTRSPFTPGRSWGGAAAAAELVEEPEPPQPASASAPVPSSTASLNRAWRCGLEAGAPAIARP
jgi:hypothetical protein